MKKLISVVMAIMLMLASGVQMQTITFAKSETEIIRGDVNDDEKVDIVDVVIIRSYIVGTKTLTEEQLVMADMNNDEKVDIVDVVMIRRAIVGGTSGEVDTDSEIFADTDTSVDSEPDSEIITDTDTSVDSESDSEIESDEDTDNTEIIYTTYEVWVIDNDTPLRIRTAPSLSASVLTKLSGGETIRIYQTADAEGYKWGKIHTVNGDGTYDGNWCSLDYATKTGTVTEETVINKNPDTDSDSNPDTSKIIDTLPATKTPGQSVQMIRVKQDFTSVYNANHKSSYQSPIYSQLPEDTLEYFSSNDGTYYISDSGRKYPISSGTTEVVNGTTFGDNTIQVKSISESDKSTTLIIKNDDKTAFNIQPYFVNYNHMNDADYFYTVDSFEPTEIRIVFDNATAVTQLPAFSGSSLFDSIKWTKVTDNGQTKFCLTLGLRKTGIYNGSKATYDANGNLVIKFTKYPALLAEAVIVIDPGHDIVDPGAQRVQNGVTVNERDINAATASKLADKLRLSGATVYILPSATQQIDHRVRAAMARQYNPDFFISIHCNATVAQTTSTRGAQAYYFNAMSQPLAQSVVNRVTSVLGTSNVSNKCLEGEYSVTLQNDFSSILLETAFMSNPSDLAILTNPDKQDQIATAIRDGINDFCAREN